MVFSPSALTVITVVPLGPSTCRISAVSTPAYFGEDKSQAIVGVQMACAYVGSLLMPPLFGIIAQYATISLYPWYLLVLLVLMVAMHERLRKLRG